jgi:hypothetical protein
MSVPIVRLASSSSSSSSRSMMAEAAAGRTFFSTLASSPPPPALVTAFEPSEGGEPTVFDLLSGRTTGLTAATGGRLRDSSSSSSLSLDTALLFPFVSTAFFLEAETVRSTSTSSSSSLGTARPFPFRPAATVPVSLFATPPTAFDPVLDLFDETSVDNGEPDPLASFDPLSADALWKPPKLNPLSSASSSSSSCIVKSASVTSTSSSSSSPFFLFFLRPEALTNPAEAPFGIGVPRAAFFPPAVEEAAEVRGLGFARGALPTGEGGESSMGTTSWTQTGLTLGGRRRGTSE